VHNAYSNKGRDFDFCGVTTEWLAPAKSAALRTAKLISANVPKAMAKAIA
jgi:hypothetical protein